MEARGPKEPAEEKWDLFAASAQAINLPDYLSLKQIVGSTKLCFAQLAVQGLGRLKIYYLIVQQDL